MKIPNSKVKKNNFYQIQNIGVSYYSLHAVTVSKRRNRMIQNDCNWTTFLEHLIDILRIITGQLNFSNSTKYNYNGNEDGYASFNEIRIQTTEIIILKAVKT